MDVKERNEMHHYYRKLKALPRSKAKTAWGLLRDVRKAILEEPKRANMRTSIADRHPHEGGPACGTVGCIAGWTTILAGKDHDFQNTIRRARMILGQTLDYYTVGRGDTIFGRDVFNSGEGDRCQNTRPGTQAHADAVVKRLDKFMRINATALRKRRLA